MYDDRHLSITGRSVNLIFSQQLLEHVYDDVLDAFYSEEDRVMKLGAKVVHQAPHLLMPFESHSNTWFIHWLPRVFQMPI